MVGLGSHCQHLQFNIGTQDREEMVALRGHCLGRRFGQGDVLLERLVMGFHFPSFAIAGGDFVVGEVEITGDQIQNNDAAIPVCEDLFNQMAGEICAHQINGHDRPRFNLQCIKLYIVPVNLVLKAQRHFAIVLQRHDKVTPQLVFDEHHVVYHRKPDVIQHIAEENLVLHGLTRQLAINFVLRTVFRLACLFVSIDFGFFHQMIVHRQRNPFSMVQRRDDVDAFDGLSTGMIVMPADDGVFVRIRLLRDAVIHNQYIEQAFIIHERSLQHLDVRCA